MKVKLKEDFDYSPDGITTITAEKGDTLEGDPAKWAMAQGKAERATEKPKAAPQKKDKQPANKK